MRKIIQRCIAFVARWPYVTGFTCLYFSISLVIMHVQDGGYFSKRIEQGNELLEHGVKLELREPTYAVKYRASNNVINSLVVVNAYGEGQSLLFNNVHDRWEFTAIREVPSGYVDALLLTYVEGHLSHLEDLPHDNDRRLTGFGKNGERYFFVLSSHWERIGSPKLTYNYRLRNEFGCRDHIDVMFTDIPWINRKKQDLYVGRLNYVWAIPADLVVTPLLLMALPFALNYSEFN